MTTLENLKAIEAKHVSHLQCAEAFVDYYVAMPRHALEDRLEAIEYFDAWQLKHEDSMFKRGIFIRLSYCKAQYYNMMGDYKVLFRIIAEIKGLETKESDNYYLGKIHRLLALACFYIGLVEQALEHGYKSMRLFESINNERESVSSLMTVAIAYSLLEDYDLQLKYFREGYKRALTLKDTGLVMLFLNNISYTLILKGDYGLAKKYILEADACSQAKDDALYSVGLLINKLRIAIKDGEVALAQSLLAKINSHKSLTTEQTLVMDTLLLRMDLYGLMANVEGQEAALLQGLALAEHVKSDKYLMVFYEKLSDFYSREDNCQAAFKYQRAFMTTIKASEKKKANYQYIYMSVQYEVEHIRQEMFDLKHQTQELRDALASTQYELKGTQETAIFALASLAEYRDQVTGKHILRTIKYVEAFCKFLQMDGFDLSEAYIKDLSKSSALHDIGKVGIKDEILNKPGKLTKEEFDEIKQHTLIGKDALSITEQILGKGSFLSLAQTIAYSHHEKWDGSGYPEGLSGENIPFEGRLIALIDVYDALVSKRPYKPPYSHLKAIRIIKEGIGSHFDPVLSQKFLDNHTLFYEIAYELIDSDEERNALQED